MKRIRSLFFVIFLFCALTSAAQIHESSSLETAASFGRHMAIGLSVNSDNRLFVSFPNSDGEGNLALAEVKEGKLSPYPDKEWNQKGEELDHFLRVQDLFVDSRDRLWVLDSKPAAKGNIFDDEGEASGKFKLVKINTKTNEVEDVFLFEDLDKENSALNDVRVDPERGFAYFSDPGMAAIVVLNLHTRKTRVVLKETKFTLADDLVPVYSGREMRNKNGNPFSSSVNGIALTPDFQYFYFKPINKKELFRIETRLLMDSSLTDETLSHQVETVAKPGVTHGLIADKKGNVYLTTSEDYSISFLTPEGTLRTLVQDPRLLWPDSFGIGSDGYLYFTCAQMQQLPQWNNGEDKTEYPYRAYRVKLP